MAAATSAVYIKDAYKHYGPKSGPKRKDVLEGLCMRVNRGSIYGLLGASGCGKTTLLSCIVGRKLFNSGELWVLGGTPGTKGSGVPGPRVGYMPQETALIAEFTVKGIVFYFGRIFGMSEKQISSRFRELSTLLDLPPDDRMVGNCSGGQQRRISFAAAMIHDPELLILDEPTVGLDPVLRERIWEYLVEITAKKNISVIITTHYIEECRQASTIGLMRQGKLLAEESPDNLLVQFQTDTLEDVFLELSRQQAEGRLAIKPPEEGPPEENNISSNDLNTISIAGSVTTLDTTTGSTNNILKNTMADKIKKKSNNYSPFTIKGDRFLALLIKNWIQYFKNTGGLIFTVMFPLVQMTVFFLGIGADPKALKIAIVNDEFGNCSNFDLKSYVHFNNDSECEFEHLSCKFIQEMEDPMIVKVFYDDLETAISGVNSGDIYGTMYFPSNYTRSTKERALEGKDATDDAIEYGEVKVWIDMSSKQVGPILKRRLLNIYREFQKGILKTCNYNPQVGEIPINFKDPIYGWKDEEFTVFMMPGFLVTIVFFVATMMTSTVLITERLEGVWDRTLVAGATAMEILTTHICTQFTIVIFQIIETVAISLYVFNMKMVGDLAELMFLMFAIGFTGMCYGFLVSIYCANHSQANFAATGSFYPMLMISGIMWPVEGMPSGLSFIAHCFPFTIPVEALRNIMRKGFHTNHPSILHGYGICAGWSVFFILFSFYLLKTKM